MSSLKFYYETRSAPCKTNEYTTACEALLHVPSSQFVLWLDILTNAALTFCRFLQGFFAGYNIV